jgi:hypothetical protein
MSRPNLIPENLLIPVLKEWESGKNAEQIADWLRITHSVDVSARNVNSRVKAIRDIELQAKKDAIAKHASEQALDYISMMDNDILKINKITDQLLSSEDQSNWLLAKQLVETKLKLIDKQMNLTGMDRAEKTELDQDIIVDGLLNKINKTN